MIELFILLGLAIFDLSFCLKSNETDEGTIEFIGTKVGSLYDKFAPYSFKEVHEKTKALGYEFTMKEYVSQIVLFAGVAGGISYLYFYSIPITVFYALVAVAFIPYLSYLRSMRLYSEFIFEQIQTYTTNVIMEFNTTQSFVKALEGVVASGILEDPVKSDVQKMIDMSYANGTIDQSVAYFNEKYPYYMVKNMHQLFLQVTKEGARDSGEALEDMSLDIDALVEGVYRDRMDRSNFYKKFITFGMALFLLVAVMQALLGRDSYLELIQAFYVKALLHAIIIINCGFLLSGVKYYNEDVGAE